MDEDTGSRNAGIPSILSAQLDVVWADLRRKVARHLRMPERHEVQALREAAVYWSGPDSRRKEPSHPVEVGRAQQWPALPEPRMVVREHVHRAHDVILVVVLARRRPSLGLAPRLVERVIESEDVPSLMGEERHVVVARGAKDFRTGCAAITD